MSNNRYFDYDLLRELLKDEDDIKVNDLCTHIESLEKSKNKKGEFTCAWFAFLNPELIIKLFKKALSEGLWIDGKNVTIENRGGKIGLSYNYIAYKNKLLNIYPEAKIDFDVVYKDDDFNFQKKDGKVFYSHKLNNPFSNSDDDLIGAYCVIKINTGEFLITLDRQEINKIRSKAKTTTIWNDWFRDMCLKSAIKKLVSKHFNDIYTNIIEEDNQDSNVDNPIDIEEQMKQEIESIETVEGLNKYYTEHKSKVVNTKSFIEILSIRKNEINGHLKDNTEKYIELVTIKKPEEAEKLILEFSELPISKQLQVYEELQAA
jgi:hypothetical protein